MDKMEEFAITWSEPMPADVEVRALQTMRDMGFELVCQVYVPDGAGIGDALGIHAVDGDPARCMVKSIYRRAK